MDNVSVSKGVFPHKGSYKFGQRKKSECIEYLTEPWYIAYKDAWKTVQEAVQTIRSDMMQNVMRHLSTFIKEAQDSALDERNYEIPAAILLTGVNVPDHAGLFESIIAHIKRLTSHIVLLGSRDCNAAVHMVEEMVYQLMNSVKNGELAARKSQCTMRLLKAAHEQHLDPQDAIVVILPDFESFPANALHDFILILSSYARTMKFVLIFGVATTLHVVHRSLSYNVTSKLITQVFHVPTQVESLSDVLGGTVLSPEMPFKLTGKAFQLLTDIFLFCDFSVDSFLQNYKLCMIQHFYGNNVSTLCCPRKDIKRRLKDLSRDDLEEVKNLPSIVRHLQVSSNCETDELSIDEFRVLLERLLNRFHEYMDRFLVTLRCLHGLTSSLPNAPLGRQLREVYTKAVYTGNLSESAEYKECLQLLGFLSKEELLAKLDSALTLLGNPTDPIIAEFKTNLTSRASDIRAASLDVSAAPSDVVSADEKLSRAQLKEKLLKLSKQHSRSPYKQAQQDLIAYLDERIFSAHLVNPGQVPAHEIFCYSDGNLAKNHIRGSLRAAIHTGLNDPRVYLECDCCKLESDDAIPRTLPDLSVIYKLHLESGKLINMYDWLQAFRTVVDPDYDPENQKEVDPKIQARFTRAVAELQFLGFVKSSRRKTDHVKRLT